MAIVTGMRKGQGPKAGGRASAAEAEDDEERVVEPFPILGGKPTDNAAQPFPANGDDSHSSIFKAAMKAS